LEDCLGHLPISHSPSLYLPNAVRAKVSPFGNEPTG
jgi:hypothetical protein